MFGTTLLLAALAVLTGCIRYDLDISLFPDDQARLQLDLAIDEATADYLGEDPQTLWDSVTQDLEDELPPGAQFQNYATDGWIGSVITLPTRGIGEISADDGMGVGMNITRVGNQFHFQGNAGDIEAEFSEENLPIGDFSAAQAHVRLTCPGDIIEANGTIDANVVTWNLLEMDGNMSATCDATGDGVSAPAGGGSVGTAVSETGLARWWPVLALATALTASLVGLGIYLRRKAHSERSTWNNPAPQGEYEVGGYWEHDNRD
jgi:hypothetical protein